MQHSSFLWWLFLSLMYVIGLCMCRLSSCIAINYQSYINANYKPDMFTFWYSLKRIYIHNNHDIIVSSAVSWVGIVKAIIATIIAICFVILFVLFGYSLQLLFMMFFMAILILLAYIDSLTFLLPDVLIVPLIVVGILNFVLVNGVDVITPFMGLLFGYSVLFVLNKVWHFVYNESGFGAGDLKLMAAVGVWLGVSNVLTVLFIASITNSLYAMAHQCSFKPKGYYPFGPFIAIGAIVTLICDKYVLIY